MELSEFEGVTYGPNPWLVSSGSVRDFVDLTGDDPDRWTDHAPPGFAAASLFIVAPDLLQQLTGRSVVHGEQTFSWLAPLVIGADFEVSGAVTRVRDRGGVNFVTFEIEARNGSDTLLTGKSLFLVSGESLPAAEPGFERPEPPHSFRGDLVPGQVSASRADLVRYASATRDWNPVHWDHAASVAAGFPGVVVHGLLQAGWALRSATPPGDGRPFESARFRFRNPMLPARPARVDLEGTGTRVDVTIADEESTYLTASVVLADG